MAAGLVALGLGLKGAELIARHKAGKKQDEATKKREKAIDRESRKSAIGRALGAPTGTARKIPSGVADTSKLDTLGGLAGLGSSLAFRGSTAKPAGGGGELMKAGARPTADNQAIKRVLGSQRNTAGSFPISGLNLG